MGTTNPGGKALPTPDAAGQQEEKGDGLWKDWTRFKNPKDVPQENGGQEINPSAGSENPVAPPAARPRTPEEPATRKAPWAQMATRGGAQAPTRQQRGLGYLVKPGQFDSGRP